MQNQSLRQISQDVLDLEIQISMLLDLEVSPGKEVEKEQAIEQVFREFLQADSQFNDKALKVAAYIQYLEELASTRKKEEERIAGLRRTVENKAERLKAYLLHEIQCRGKSKIEGDFNVIQTRKKPPRVEVKVPAEQLPEDFQRISVSIAADKQAIAKVLKSGKTLDFAELVDNGSSLVIK